MGKGSEFNVVCLLNMLILELSVTLSLSSHRPAGLLIVVLDL